MHEEGRLKKEKAESAHLASTSIAKKKNKVKEAVDKAPQKKQLKKPGDMKNISYFFCGVEGQKKKHCTNYHSCAEKGMLFNLVYSKVDLT